MYLKSIGTFTHFYNFLNYININIIGTWLLDEKLLKIKLLLICVLIIYKNKKKMLSGGAIVGVVSFQIRLC